MYGLIWAESLDQMGPKTEERLVRLAIGGLDS